MKKNERRNWNLQKSIYEVFKRIFDIIISLIGIIVLFPIMLIIGILIKLDSPGPILFKQLRTGKYGKNFYMYKFRTMVADNDARDFSKGDQHTKIGTLLRKTSLDEIPQLYAILIGRMSFVGPRPWITEYYEYMNEEQRHRVDVTPGLTGLAQARGRNSITIFDKINNDLEYIDKYSLKEDIYVILLTIKTVLTKEGADAGKGTIHNELDDLKNQHQTTSSKKTKNTEKSKTKNLENGELVIN